LQPTDSLTRAMLTLIVAAGPAMRAGAMINSNMHGCGGATPFTERLGGSSVEAEAMWAAGGDVHVRLGHGSTLMPQAPETKEPAKEVTKIAASKVAAVPAERVQAPAFVATAPATGSLSMHGCGGATPFEAFRGGGSIPQAHPALVQATPRATMTTYTAQSSGDESKVMPSSMLGCGGATPFTERLGGSSALSHDQWAAGGDAAQRRGHGTVTGLVKPLAAAPVEEAEAAVEEEIVAVEEAEAVVA